MQGKIIKGIAGFYYIYAENDEIYECKAKGIFRKDKQKPLVGDNVEIEVLDEQEKEGSVTAILPRKNSLIRPAVANVDQAFVIFAMENPKPNFMLLDRFLIMMEKENVPAVICFNKKDLAKQEELELLYETYKSCGYDVIFSSTFNGEGLDEIREILKGKTTVVAGPSGVGKSSIPNALQENVQMETGEISKKLKRGKHTTRHSQVIPVGHDTYLMDTPGFSSLYLTDIEEQELKAYFPEFRRYEEQCRFQADNFYFFFFISKAFLQFPLSHSTIGNFTVHTSFFINFQEFFSIFRQTVKISNNCIRQKLMLQKEFQPFISCDQTGFILF